MLWQNGLGLRRSQKQYVSPTNFSDTWAEHNTQGFALANQTNKPIYEYFSDHPERARRFANMMKAFTRGPGYSLAHVTDHFPWADIGRGTVVDVCKMLGRQDAAGDQI